MKTPCPDFHLEATLASGQVFGFEETSPGSFRGRLLGAECQLLRQGSLLHVQAEKRLSESAVRRYFDLDRDLSPVYSLLEREDPLRPALYQFRGLRLIRQDPWEALACFILSSNNNVKRIQGIYRNLCDHFGAFPSPAQIASLHERVLRGLGIGYRAPYLLGTAKFLAANDLYLDEVRRAEYPEALARVQAFPGIGPKVADCALLYGFHRLDTFPVDVWILRAMRQFYFRGRRVSEKRVHDYGRKRWGAWAGYVQQYIFHGARSGVLLCS